jgi:hypothetical protein
MLVHNSVAQQLTEYQDRPTDYLHLKEDRDERYLNKFYGELLSVWKIISRFVGFSQPKLTLCICNYPNSSRYRWKPIPYTGGNCFTQQG